MVLVGMNRWPSRWYVLGREYSSGHEEAKRWMRGTGYKKLHDANSFKEGVVTVIMQAYIRCVGGKGAETICCTVIVMMNSKQKKNAY